ncbi:MAG TPA: hypothetical protein VFI43_08240 [Nitrosospira sp.]|nr:hypothetical protein [Nitrosospira sp.]
MKVILLIARTYATCNTLSAAPSPTRGSGENRQYPTTTLCPQIVFFMPVLFLDAGESLRENQVSWRLFAFYQLHQPLWT